jgi:hypothetical protein
MPPRNNDNNENVDVRILQKRFADLKAQADKPLPKKPRKGGKPPHIPSMPEISREEIAAQIAAAEARSATSLARVEGKIETAVASILGELKATRDDVRQADQYNRDSRLVILGAIVASVLALAGLVVSLATYGDAVFSRGMSVRDVIQSTIKDYQATQPKQP